MFIESFFTSNRQSLKPMMLRTAHNLKISNIIIMSVAINMMNVFRSFKFSTKKLFHNISMKPNLFTFNLFNFIVKRFISVWMPLRVRVSVLLRNSSTSKRTGNNVMGNTWNHIKRLFTVSTYNFSPTFYEGKTSLSLVHDSIIA